MGQPVNGGAALLSLNGTNVKNIDMSTGTGTYTYTASQATDTLVANYSGVNGQYNPSSGSDTQNNSSPDQNTVTTVTCSPSPGVIGQPVTVTVTVSTTP